MATEGGVREGWNYAYGPRYDETLFRGQVTVTGSALVTLPLPVRLVTFATASPYISVAPGLDPVECTVGNVTNNTFTIYLWKATSATNPTLIASTTPTVVHWFAWGNLTGRLNQP